MSAVATVPRFVGSALFPRRQLRAFLLTVRNGQLEFGHRTCADGHLPHRTGAGNPVTSTDVTRQCTKIQRKVEDVLANEVSSELSQG